jgi:hypothetical protein
MELLMSRKSARGRRWPELMVWLVVGGVFGLFTLPCWADDPPRLLKVEPARAGELVVCKLVTAGLPGEKLSLSMQSGLVSSIELFLDLLDERKKVRAGNHITLQLAFDLWEEIYSLEENGHHHRFADMEGLISYLNELPHFPVAPLKSLTPAGQFRIRVGLLLHPIAPSERHRVERVIGGDNRNPSTGDRQEVSISLGQLIRFFYKDGSGRPKPQSELLSQWFRLEDLVLEDLSDAED